MILLANVESPRNCQLRVTWLYGDEKGSTEIIESVYRLTSVSPIEWKLMPKPGAQDSKEEG